MNRSDKPALPEDPAKPDDPSAPDHMRDPRKAEQIDPHSGMSDDPRVDPTPDQRQSTT